MSGIKLKSGILLFIFLFALGFFVIRPIGLYNAPRGIFGIGVIIITSFLLAGIFLLSLYRSEKRILNNQYGVGWLLKFNALLILTLYAIGLSYLLITTAKFSASEDVRILLAVYYIYGEVILYGTWLIPLSIFVFSVIPSLFFAKFYGNHRLFRVISWTAVASFIVLSSFNLYTVITCEGGRQYECLAVQVLWTKNTSVCERGKHWSHVDGCYLSVSKGWDDVNICDKFSHVDSFTFNLNQNRCLQNIAVYNKDPKICERITIDNVDFGKSKCFSDIQGSSH